ncbi:hypothetical protein JCM10599A_09680 [Paraburkholderia kururiensis]
MKEPLVKACRPCHGSSKDAPAKGFGLRRPADESCPLTLTPGHIRVETVKALKGIVGELTR